MFFFGYILVGLTRILSIAVNTICLILLIRIIVDLFVSPSYYHPILGYFRDITEPVVGPFRKLIPLPQFRIKFDLVAALVLVVLFIANRIVSGVLLGVGYSLGGTPYIRSGFVNFLHTILTIYYWVIIFRVIISWVNPDPYNQIVVFLNRITEPYLSIFRRYIPVWRYGFDFTPLVAILTLFFIDYAILGILNRIILTF